MTFKPKKIGGTTVLSEQGVNLIARVVLSMGFVWYQRGAVDAGIDGEIEIRDPTTGVVTNALIGVQSKAVGDRFLNETPNGFDFYCNQRDVDYWLKGNLPVILVVSRPSTDEAYWISVKRHFKGPENRASHRIHFDKSIHRFDATCRKDLAELAIPREQGTYLAPVSRTETLVSNLLPVALLSSSLFVGQARFVLEREIRDSAREQGVNLGNAWIVRNRMLISFSDLTRSEWGGVCERGTVEEFPTVEWALTDDPDRRRDFVDLLQRTLREMVQPQLEYHRPLELLYFPATPDLTPREFDYQGPAKLTDRTVFRPYVAGNGTVIYYRHSAFVPTFHRFDDTWYLEITPTYHFTSDGYRTRPNYERFLKRIKEIEGHDAVRGQVWMWASLLTPRGDMLKTEPYPFLGFGDLVTFSSDHWIDDFEWDKKKDANKILGEADKGSSDQYELWSEEE